MLLDCAVIGGGPAGLSASLVLGRSRKKTVLFDDNRPRNAVTSEAHGFITRDGINPQELKRIAQEELSNYPAVRIEKQRVQSIVKEKDRFRLSTEDGEVYRAKKVILATGFKEIMPAIERVAEFYGKSLFSCPFCDGWELRDRPLAIISDNPRVMHLAKVTSNWTQDLIVCTDGKQILSLDEKKVLESKGIKVNEKKIRSLIGENGKLEKIEFEDGQILLREGGFITPEWKQAAPFGVELGCRLNDLGGIETDNMQRTNIDGLFACGDTRIGGSSQLILAAGEGSMAAFSVIASFTEEKFALQEDLDPNLSGTGK